MTEKEKKIYDNKISKVMAEWKDRTLTRNGKKVKSQKQALAIAINSAIDDVEEYRKKKKK